VTTALWRLLAGTIAGLGAATVVVLALLIGACVIVGWLKLRPSGRETRVVRSLDEALGRPERYLPPTAPRGPVDQLRAAEPAPAAARQSG
jgi:hypothetical protein